MNTILRCTAGRTSLLRYISCLLLLSVVPVTGCSLRGAPQVAQAPIANWKNFPALTSSRDGTLQVGLERTAFSLGLRRAVQERRVAIAIADISDPYQPHFAEINGDEMMYAASLPKIAILFGLFKKIELGELEWSEKIHDLAHAMIRYSSNDAAKQLYYTVGPEFILTQLQARPYLLYDRARGGGLWVGKEYGSAPAWKRDPLHSLSHGASASQVARFYYLLDTGRLVRPDLLRKMKETLAYPGLWHKFVRGLGERCMNATLYRKSGSWEEYHSDSAIVEHMGRRYIAVVLAHDPAARVWLEELIVEIDRLILGNEDHFKDCSPTLQHAADDTPDTFPLFADAPRERDALCSFGPGTARAMLRAVGAHSR